MLSLASASFGFAPTTFSAPAQARADVRMESMAELEALSKKLNPVIGYWGEPPPAAASPRRSPPSVEAWA